ncbi:MULTISPECIES: transglutaminase-like domain-containing protein [unclassified Paenibacillus]|uniref:transglutaminase-like domain-containing protein n=1 Tax=unclassified Paenibacillus TaxID=185978 RepID=UPI001AE3AD1F|nr:MULTISPECIES: transglutaminase-like domain-containing protein [unclassified Paenibacillus]MBP1157496.1 transglutaminase-like putative cysteine protease [Paenibacillus sp. PvP091]MBP1171767.1 transglutaminase-like putative cysteine protease [Paenibacillus sp. PvR098]MBP2438148.1 transglutaminase-like putative cysteine protease [Paenibacillus sp. PvP052]
MPYPAPKQAAAGNAAIKRTAAPTSWAADAALSAVLLLLLLEWLYPLHRLSEITEVSSIMPFAITFMLLVAVDTLRLPGWAIWPVKVLWIVGTTAWLHNGHALPSLDWWANFGHELRIDAAEGLEGNLAAWEPATRTLLFMTGWAFFISVLQSFVLERRQVLWFWGMTLFYLVFIQWVFAIDMFPAVLRCTGISLLLQGMLQQGRWIYWRLEAADSSSETYEPAARDAALQGSAAPLAGLLLAAACLTAGWLGTLLHPQEMRELDWSRYIRAFEERFRSEVWDQRHTAGAAQAGRTGYGSDDTRLGQPLQLDESPAFVAVTPRLTYWRGEAKSYYTGQGWIQPDSRMVQYLADPPGWDTATAAEHSYYVPVKQTIRIQDESLTRQLFAGGELIRVVSLQSVQGQPISTDGIWRQLWSDRITLPVRSDPLAEYEIESLIPADRTALALMTDSHTSYPSEIEERFLHLPGTLPERVKQLAASIVAQESSAYAKAVAIERYLREHYAYSLLETRTVQGKEDVVDRFLFEQKTGYCDHFSSAMVVLLRSVGVPARWVKGFTPGEILAVDGEEGSERYTVQVRQKDAHSWAEVYFPSVGWVPFEPTPAYSGSGGEAPSSALAGSGAPSASESGAWGQMAGHLRSAADSLLSMARSLHGSLSTAAGAAGAVIHKLLSTQGISSLWKLSLWIAAAGLAALMLLIPMWTRKARLASASSEWGSTAIHSLRRAALLRFSDRLWRRLQHSHGPAAPSMTLREYAGSRRCQTEAQRVALMQLAEQLETLQYADPDHPDTTVTRRSLVEAWRHLKRSRKSVTTKP